jgi:hypothetical protein
MARPNKQIDDKVCEMTEEEYAQHEKDIADYVPLVLPSDE